MPCLVIPYTRKRHIKCTSPAITSVVENKARFPRYWSRDGTYVISRHIITLAFEKALVHTSYQRTEISLMKRLCAATLLLTIAWVPALANARPLNWMRHTKKPAPVSSTKVEYHGSAAYSAEGRLYFPTAGHNTPVTPAHAKVRAPRVK